MRWARFVREAALFAVVVETSPRNQVAWIAPCLIAERADSERRVASGRGPPLLRCGGHADGWPRPWRCPVAGATGGLARPSTLLVGCRGPGSRDQHDLSLDIGLGNEAVRRRVTDERSELRTYLAGKRCKTAHDRQQIGFRAPIIQFEQTNWVSAFRDDRLNQLGELSAFRFRPCHVTPPRLDQANGIRTPCHG